MASGLEQHSAASDHTLEQPVRRGGVSVVICCHNSGRRLPAVLAHLAAQQVPDDLPWEVLVIDNASTDDTAAVARMTWPAHIHVPVRVVPEPKLGLIHARHRGFAEAMYEFVSFIDDDNRVAPDWIKIAAEVMQTHPEVGACGGLSEAVFETNPPPWFDRYQEFYAVGPQGEPGDITWTKGFLWGAGLTIRQSAWRQIVKRGFCSTLTGRQGARLSTGEDVEISFALRRAGWRLWFEPRLRLQHFLPQRRLQWTYLRSLNRANGAATVSYDPYTLSSKRNSYIFEARRSGHWRWQALATARDLALNPRRWLRLAFQNEEGDPAVLWIDWRIGRLLELLQRRGQYDRSVRNLLEAQWSIQ
ncbi:glycosyltransferase [Nitrolancea hollandica]|nr:glycosyltransferase [Nitrolancea hollandica]